MPRHEGEVRRMERMPLEERLRELDRCQEHWYKLVAHYVNGKSVLDVGAGTGYGLPILAEYASAVTGVDPLPAGPGVVNRPVEEFSDGSFDVVTAMDVIEHIEDDVTFLHHLLRVAREAVFLSTPNWDRFQAINPFHFREYTADELDTLLRTQATGCTYTAWHSDDHPTKHLPWRVPSFGLEATNYGIWIWKGKPLHHRIEPEVDLWNEQSDSFLSDDRPNPARAAAAEIIRNEVRMGSESMVEIGPGPGYDYRDLLCHIHGLTYRAYEATAGLRRIFLGAAPTANVVHGTFLDLALDSADIVYTKATLEHQRDFRDGLQRMLQAARRCVLINWYLPPAAEYLRYEAHQKMYYNTYAKDAVLGFLADHGFKNPQIIKQPSGNELWVIRKLPYTPRPA